MKWKSIEAGEYPAMLDNIIFWHEDNTNVLYGIAMPDGVHFNGNVFLCSHWMPLPKPPKSKT